LSESLLKLQRKKKRKNDQGSQRLTRSGTKGGKNQRTNVRCDVDEALSYEKGEMEKTTHNVCTRQLKDDANRSKCRKNQHKEERKYLFMIERVMKEVGDSGS